MHIRRQEKQPLLLVNPERQVVAEFSGEESVGKSETTALMIGSSARIYVHVAISGLGIPLKI